MRFDELNESNYMLFAIKFYDNPQAVTKDDFESDLKRIPEDPKAKVDTIDVDQNVIKQLQNL